jgi:hypothetical protein
MISLQVNHEAVDINDSASFSIAASSPFVEPGEIAGPKIYNLSARKTRRNQRIFGFAEQLNNVARAKEFPEALIKFYGLLWKQGTLKLRDFSGSYNFSFHTDAGDIGLKIKNRKLSELNLGSAANDGNVSQSYPAANHVFFTVNNPDFYGDKNPDYGGVINQLSAGVLATNSTTNQYNVVPFPYLLFVLEKVFQQLGYRGIEGAWTEEEPIKRVVLFNTYDLAKMDTGVNVYADTITYANHMPNVSVGSFLIDVAITFGITYIVNPVTKKVEIKRLKDWLSNPAYLNLNGRASGSYKLEPNQANGFTFRQQAESSDKALEPEPAWLEYRSGNGEEEINTTASPLEIDNGVPYTLQQGAGPAFELPAQGRSGLRFMLFTGSGTGHYQEGGFSLRWAGTDGIINRCYSEWVEWKQYTEKVEREVELSVVELLQLDLERKLMIDNLKWIVADYQGSISNDGRKKPVKLTLYSIRQ